MKSIITEGTVEKASCEHCQRFVEATYSYGAVEVDGLVVEDVMRGVCNLCGAVVSLAPQSAHRFKKALEDRRQKRTTLRMPQELHDFISLSLSSVGADSTHTELYFRALLLACRGQEDKVGKAVATLCSSVLNRPNSVTVNLTLGSHLLEVLERLQAASGISGVGELIRRLVVLADGSLEKAVSRECERLAHAYA